jgi:AraC-like DNA-binding protein
MNKMPVDFRTSDLDEFREAVAGLFIPFSLIPRAKQYDARLRHRRLGTLSFSHIAYDKPIDIDIPPLLPLYMVQLTLRGSCQIRTTGVPYLISEKCAQLAPPRIAQKMHCPAETDFLVITIDPSEFAEACALGGEDDRLLATLPETLPLAGPGESLARCLQFLLVESLHPDTLLGGERAATRHAKQMLYSLLLDFADGSPRPVLTGRAWYIKRAEEFMEANLGADIGIADVAASTSISMRALQYGFRNAHGIAPMVWLKQRRLDRVHTDLLAADPAETSVTDIAFRWGFIHLGRFAADYRARFGELPSVTLHRR